MRDSIKYDKRRLPIEKRTIPMPASGTHDGKWFRCWNCGFPCFTDRDKLGDGKSYAVTEVVDASPSSLTGDKRDSTISFDFFQSGTHLMQLDLIGDTVPAERLFTQQVVMGCPMCGCNYK